MIFLTSTSHVMELQSCVTHLPLCGAGDQTQAFFYARQTLYHPYFCRPRSEPILSKPKKPQPGALTHLVALAGFSVGFLPGSASWELDHRASWEGAQMRRRGLSTSPLPWTLSLPGGKRALVYYPGVSGFRVVSHPSPK